MAGDAPTPGTGDDHSTLLSELDSHDLTFTMGVGESTGTGPFDADASPDDTFPQSVASGGPTPTRPEISSPRTTSPTARCVSTT